MKNCIGIINSGNERKDYGTLTKNRPDYMLPFGSRYRTIDFTLSNFAEHGLSKVLLFGGMNIRSTLDHVGTGKSWGLDKRVDGLMINPPVVREMGGVDTEMVTYYNSLRFFSDAEHKYVYISNPMILTRIDINKAYQDFLENEYDVMFIYRKQEDENGDYLNARKIIFDENDNIINIGHNLGTENIFNMYVENMFIKKDLFMSLVKESVEKGNADTLIQAIFNNKRRLKIGGLELFRHVEFIRDLNSYYKANTNLLNYGIYADLLLAGEGIKTKSKDEPSTLYLEGNNVSNSIVANGCIIEGDVQNSVIFRGAKIGKNAIVKNSIIYQKAVIEDNAIVVNSILDKNVIIKEKVFVQGAQNNPYIVEKNMVVEE